MKRALRNTETAMFVKSDGGETETIQTARSFLTYDEAIAFCKANRLAAVELVTRTDEQEEYVTSVPARYLAPVEEDDTTVSVEPDQPSVEAQNEPEFQRAIIPDSESNTRAVVTELPASEPDIGCVAQVQEVALEPDGCRLNLNCECECEACEVEAPAEAEEFVRAVDETEVAIYRYAKFEMAAQTRQFHIRPPEKCGLCGAELSHRWFFVDGQVRESGEWQDMCSQCFFSNSVAIGPGKGQLYQRQTDGRWLLVGGFGR